jgi:hypothetical protein
METVAFYRNHAAECLAIATTATDPAHKRLFVAMAASWHDLAALAASEETPLRPIVPTTHPALDESDALGKECDSKAVRRKLTPLLFSPPFAGLEAVKPPGPLPTQGAPREVGPKDRALSVRAGDCAARSSRK